MKQHTRNKCWLNTIFLFNSNLKLRDNVVSELNKRNIGVRPVWKLMHKNQAFYQNFQKDDLEKLNNVRKGLINLPSSPEIYE